MSNRSRLPEQHGGFIRNLFLNLVQSNGPRGTGTLGRGILFTTLVARCNGHRCPDKPVRPKQPVEPVPDNYFAKPLSIAFSAATESSV